MTDLQRHGDRETRGPRVILAGPDEAALVSRAYPAFQAMGFDVTAAVDTLEQLRDVVAASRPDVVVVEASVAPTPDETLALVSALGEVKLVVILPPVWADERERFADLPNLVAGFSAPVNWYKVAASLVDRVGVRGKRQEAGGGKEESRGDKGTGRQGDGEQRGQGEQTGVERAVSNVDQTATRTRPQGSGPTVRFGFCGMRGGVGTSTAALTAARALAAEGKRVALFDAARRGDLHLMARLDPTEQPTAEGKITGERPWGSFSLDEPTGFITFFLMPPTEEAVRGFDAAIVDGGRERGEFNAEWVAISGYLSEEKILRMVGIEPPKDEERTLKSGETPRRPPQGGLSLGKLISIEVTK